MKNIKIYYGSETGTANVRTNGTVVLLLMSLLRDMVSLRHITAYLQDFALELEKDLRAMDAIKSLEVIDIANWDPELFMSKVLRAAATCNGYGEPSVKQLK